MYNILIVDDDILVRTNFKLLLQNFAPEFGVCGEAANGADALALIPTLQPDIVFTDMRMPVMNGVDLCAKIHLAFPDIQIFALSNYDDYDYVRGALKNGAVDYILKHKLNEETLSAICLEIRKTSLSFPCTNHISNNNLAALREKFVNNLLASVFKNEPDVVHTMQVLNISLDTSQVLPIVFSIDDYAQIAKKGSAASLNTLNFSILNIGNEILEQYKNGLMTHLERENYCILLSFLHTHSKEQIDHDIRSLLNQLSSNYKTFLNISCSYSIGEITTDILLVGESFQKALSALQMKFYSGNHSVLHPQSVNITTHALSGLDYAKEKQLYTLACNGNRSETLALVDEVFQKMSENKESIANIQMVCTDMISILMRAAKQNKISLDQVFEDEVAIDQIFSQLNFMELHAWFIKCFSNICEQIERLLPGDSNYVRLALACVNRDFAKPISQQSVADEIGISAGYLSTIFKSETGQGFSDYLTSVRINTAVQHLDHGERDLHALAESCGFQDYAYFFKVFKKRMGVTPKGYLRKTGLFEKK